MFCGFSESCRLLGFVFDVAMERLLADKLLGIAMTLEHVEVTVSNQFADRLDADPAKAFGRFFFRNMTWNEAHKVRIDFRRPIVVNSRKSFPAKDEQR